MYFDFHIQPVAKNIPSYVRDITNFTQKCIIFGQTDLYGQEQHSLKNSLRKTFMHPIFVHL